MKFVINLVFQGQCRDAFERYAQIFGGKVTAMIPFSDAPVDAVPESFRKAKGVMHAWLDVDDQSLMGCDVPSGQGEDMRGSSASSHCDEIDEARRVFDALAEDGKVSMPFGPTFFSPGFGMVTDRFGTSWVVATNPAAAG